MPSVIDGTRGVTDEDRRRARRVEQDDEVAIRRALVRVGEVPELDRELVLAGRLAVGEHSPRRVAGRDRGGQCSGRLVCRRPMVGDLDQPTCLGGTTGNRPAVHHPRVGAVERAALGRQELVVRRLLDQRVAEPVALVLGRPVDDEQLRVDGLANRGREIRLGRSGHFGEDVVFDLAPGDGRDLDEVGGLLARLSQPHEEHAAEGVGQVVARARRRVRGGDQLLGEERVPVGPSRDRIEERRWHGRAQDAGDELGQLASNEPEQVEPVDTWLAFSLSQPGRQRMPTMELVGAERPDDEQPLVAHVPPQECEQVARRAVRPMEILDDEQHGPTAPSRPSRLSIPSKIRIWSQSAWVPGVERSAVVTRCRGQQFRDESGEYRQGRACGGRDRLRIDVTRQRAQHFHDRTEREGVVTERHRAALEDEPPVVAQAVRRLGHQAALADAGLAADEHDRGTRGLGRSGRRDERGELVGSTDERRAGQAAGHAADDSVGSRPSPVEEGRDDRLTPQSGRSEEKRNGVHRNGGSRPRRGPCRAPVSRLMPPRACPSSGSPPRAARSRARWVIVRSRSSSCIQRNVVGCMYMAGLLPLSAPCVRGREDKLRAPQARRHRASCASARVATLHFERRPGPHPLRPSLRTATGECVRVPPTRVDRGAAGPGGHLGQGLVVEDLEHRVSDVDHDVAQRAGRLVLA